MKLLKPKLKLSHPWRNDLIGTRYGDQSKRKKALAEVRRRAKLLAK